MGKNKLTINVIKKANYQSYKKTFLTRDEYFGNEYWMIKFKTVEDIPEILKNQPIASGVETPKKNILDILFADKAFKNYEKCRQIIQVEKIFNQGNDSTKKEFIVKLLSDRNIFVLLEYNFFLLAEQIFNLNYTILVNKITPDTSPVLFMNEDIKMIIMPIKE